MVLFCSKNIINNKIKEIDMSKRLFVMMSMCIMGLFTANSLFAEDVTVDGVNYTIAKKTQTAEVKGTTNTGKIVIPSELLVDDVTYIVTSVADEAFYYNTQIKDITLPSSIQKIGNKAFCHCSHLSNIAIPQTVNYIGFNAFEFCQSLRSIEFPDSMQYVPYMAFYGCMSLREVKLPNTLTSIGSGAFRDCESLTEIVIPDSVTTFGDGVFLDCPNLKSVNIPSRVKKLSNSLFGRCSSLKEIEIPDSVAIIDDCAFYECTSLDSINTNKATQINQYAFYGCSGLASVRFGEPLKYLDYMSFANCADLCDVYSYSNIVPRMLTSHTHNPFQDSMIEEAVLHVPGSLIEEYKASDDYRKKLLEYNEMMITNQMLEAKIKALSIYRDYETADAKSRNIIINHKCEYLDNPLLNNGTLVLSDRTINLGFIVNSFLASKVEHQIDFFNNKDPHKPIFLIIDKNFGGSVLAAERIINKMKHSQSPVYVVVKELAASAAAVITAAAKKSYIYNNASIIHHQPHASVFRSLNYKESKEITEELAKAFQRFMAPVYKKIGISWDKFIDKIYAKSVSGDWSEYGDDAVKNKFADIVISDIRDTSIYTKEDNNSKFSLLSLLFGQKDQKSLKQMLDEDMLLNKHDFCYFYDITNNQKIIEYQNQISNTQK